jgi:geranylgeranyl pyrophosphate synthase
LGENGSGGEHVEAVIRLVRETGAADRVLARAHDYATEARSFLAGFPDCPAREALMAIPDLLVQRNR